MKKNKLTTCERYSQWVKKIIQYSGKAPIQFTAKKLCPSCRLKDYESK